jgi:hypothetical protein
MVRSEEPAMLPLSPCMIVSHTCLAVSGPPTPYV